MVQSTLEILNQMKRGQFFYIAEKELYILDIIGKQNYRIETFPDIFDYKVTKINNRPKKTGLKFELLCAIHDKKEGDIVEFKLNEKLLIEARNRLNDMQAKVKTKFKDNILVIEILESYPVQKYSQSKKIITAKKHGAELTSTGNYKKDGIVAKTISRLEIKKLIRDNNLDGESVEKIKQLYQNKDITKSTLKTLIRTLKIDPLSFL